MPMRYWKTPARSARDAVTQPSPRSHGQEGAGRRACPGSRCRRRPSPFGYLSLDSRSCDRATDLCGRPSPFRIVDQWRSRERSPPPRGFFGAFFGLYTIYGELHSLTLRSRCADGVLTLPDDAPPGKYHLMGQRWVPRLNTCCWAISAPPMPDWPCCRRVCLVRSSGSPLRSLLDLPTPSMRF